MYITAAMIKEQRQAYLQVKERLMKKNEKEGRKEKRIRRGAGGRDESGRVETAGAQVLCPAHVCSVGTSHPVPRKGFASPAGAPL